MPDLINKLTSSFCCQILRGPAPCSYAASAASEGCPMRAVCLHVSPCPNPSGSHRLLRDVPLGFRLQAFEFRNLRETDLE